MEARLKKPKTRAYRSFLYLNGDEVINSLSALEGGDVDEVLIRHSEEGGGEIGAEVGISPAKARGGKKRVKRFEEEVRRKRTYHSAATLLLKKLHEQEALGIVEGDYGSAIYEDLEEHELLELRAEIRIHPLHQVINAARSFVKVAATYGASKDEIRGVRETLQILELMAQPGPGEDSTFLVFAETTGTRDGYRLVLPVHEKHLLVPLDDFAGRATFVAQVDTIIPKHDQVLAIRLIRNAPQLAMERQGLEEALPELIEAFDELGIETQHDEFFLTAPAVILKPICIYK